MIKARRANRGCTINFPINNTEHMCERTRAFTDRIFTDSVSIDSGFAYAV